MQRRPKPPPYSISKSTAEKMSNYNSFLIEYAHFRNGVKKYWKMTQRVVLMIIVLLFLFFYYYKMPKVEEMLSNVPNNQPINKRYNRVELITFDFFSSSSSSSSVLMSSGMTLGKFSNQRIYTLKELDSKFVEMNNNNNNTSLCKPYVIYKHLMERTNFGDVLVFIDANTYDKFLTSIHAFLQSILTNREDIYFFSTFLANPRKEKKTEEDSNQVKFAKYLLNYPPSQQQPVIMNKVPFIIVRKSFQSIKFISEWLTYVQDKRTINGDRKQQQQQQQEEEEDIVLNLLIRKANFKIKPLANRDFISYK